MVLRICLEELLKWLRQELMRLCSPQVQRIRQDPKLALRGVIVAILIFRLAIRLHSGQIDWATFLDDLAIHLLASLIIH